MVFTDFQIAVEIALPMAPPILVQRASNAITVAMSWCGTEAWVATREPTTLNAPPREMRIWVQTSATSLYKTTSIFGNSGDGGAIRCIVSAGVERKTEGNYPDTQAKYLEVLCKKSGDSFRWDRVESNATL